MRKKYKYICLMILILNLVISASCGKQESLQGGDNEKLELMTKDIIFDESKIQNLEISMNKEREKGIIDVYRSRYFIDFEKGEKRINDIPFKNGLYVDLYYPQISGLKNAENETKINNIFKMIHFESFFENSDEVLEEYYSIMKRTEESEYKFLYLSGAYIILSIDDDLISVTFSNEISYGTGRIWSSECNITVDIQNGEILELKNAVNTNTIKEAIGRGNYEIYFGSTSEILNGVNLHDNILNDEFSRLFSNSMELEMFLNKEFMTSSFGIDEEFIYVSFECEYAMNGYLSLKIPILDVETYL